LQWEASCRRGLDMWAKDDLLNRSKTDKVIGKVHHERFRKALGRGQPDAVLLSHYQAAKQHYHQALALCPPAAIADLGPIHNELGILYNDIGQTDLACEHYERAAQYCEQSGNHYHAGVTRHNLALMYFDAADREAAPARRRDLLRRALVYAEASLRDFQRYFRCGTSCSMRLPTLTSASVRS
jgi:tetratricopeptide (TPR) repeat protein